MRTLQCTLKDLRYSLAAAAVMLASLLTPAYAQTEAFRIGGTGGALATLQLLADAYSQIHPEIEITVLPSLGSGGGIKALLAGAIQIAVSSRPLKDTETKLGAIAFEYGRTAFVFAVGRNTAIEAVTTQDLVDIYSGALQHWPDGAQIRLMLRPVGDSDSEMVRSISPEVRQAKTLAEKRPGMLFSVTDQETADNLEKISGAFGPSTLAQIITEQRALKPLRFNGIEPSTETVGDGSYPLYKPLFIVTTPDTPAAAQQFISFIRSAAGHEILAQTGYVQP
ncbi:MAG: substrate-binding domain-containing protein [Gammaproteobacteria bacterium]